MDYNSISQSLVRAGHLSTQRLTLADASADRPAPHNMELQTVPYTELNNWLDDNIPTGKDFIWYFTLAKGFSPETTTKEYWVNNFNTIVKEVPVNIAFNLEYHSDEVTLHAHGMLWNNDDKTFKEFKRYLRKSFKIDGRNRVAIKYYQNNNKNHTSLDKIQYHLVSKGYDTVKKSNLDDHYYYITK